MLVWASRVDLDRLVSSANIATCIFSTTIGRSSIRTHKRNKNGPGIDPCGTPHEIFLWPEFEPLLVFQKTLPNNIIIFALQHCTSDCKTKWNHNSSGLRGKNKQTGPISPDTIEVLTATSDFVAFFLFYWISYFDSYVWILSLEVQFQLNSEKICPVFPFLKRHFKSNIFPYISYLLIKIWVKLIDSYWKFTLLWFSRTYPKALFIWILFIVGQLGHFLLITKIQASLVCSQGSIQTFTNAPE